MEIRARYVQVGSFALAVLVAGFVFVYWLNSAGGLGSRATYTVRFDSSVSGLLKGSGVLFNGIRVGEVTLLTLDPEQPKRVFATIAVDRSTPVRADTLVTIDFQGLTGSPVILLIGGTSSQPLASEAGIPVLVADATAGQSMSGAARDVLRKLDGILADNAKPLKAMIGNLDTFAAALGRNSDKVDGIVAGIERMTGGAAKARAAVYGLEIPSSALRRDKPSSVQLVMPDPTAFSVLDNEKIQSISTTGAYTALPDVQWSDLLPKVVQLSLIRALDDINMFSGVSRVLDGVPGDFQLALDVRKFQLAPNLSAEVEIGAKLIDGKGRIIATRTMRAAVPAEAQSGPAAAAALSQAFLKVGSDIISWLGRSITESASSEGVSPKGTGE